METRRLGRTEHESSTDFRALEVYSSDGFKLGGKRRGGWFVNAVARSSKEDDPDGSLEGWFRTGDGAVAFGEPLGTATWAALDELSQLGRRLPSHPARGNRGTGDCPGR